jgi:hypothetical protein
MRDLSIAINQRHFNPNNNTMKQPTIQEIHECMKDHGMTVFSKPFDCTFGFIRTKDNKSNEMNDWLFMSHPTIGGGTAAIVAAGTSDAGLYYRLNPMHVDGTAIIQTGKQYKRALRYMEKGGHRGQEAFRQVGKMDYYRDSNKNEYLDFINPVYGKIYNTNFHDMGSNPNKVDRQSAGCGGSVIETMDLFYLMAKQQIEHGFGDHFSVAALDENMF